PRDGLTLFGPLDAGKPYGIRVGVVGTRDGIRKIVQWLERIQKPISNKPPRIARPFFPGFEAAFRIPWRPQPVFTMEVDEEKLKQSALVDDLHQRVFKTVDLFATKICSATQEDTSVDLWFVVIPDFVHKYCRPRSIVESYLQVKSDYE